MTLALEYLKGARQAAFLDKRKGAFAGSRYVSRMAKTPPRHDWYLVAWCEMHGKKQTDLVAELDWNPSKASLFWNGAQRYHRDDVNAVAEFLGIQPYELLMHPEEANAIKRLRISARQIAAASIARAPDEAGEGAIEPRQKSKLTGI